MATHPCAKVVLLREVCEMVIILVLVLVMEKWVILLEN